MYALDQLKRWCSAYAGASLDMPFGDDVLVYKAGGKIFAIIGLSHEYLHLSLKADPLIAEELRLQYASITPGYHLNKRHWNTLVLDASLPQPLVKEQLENSYQLVKASLKKSIRESL
jgi:predicted DNA-binding protein (MmcQ/YjbR family)